MDNETKARLDRVRDAARTLLAERDWFRAQADVIDAALRALGVDVPNASTRPAPKRKSSPTPGKRTADLSATEYRTNLELAEDILGQHGAAMHLHALQVEMRKRGRSLGYASVASLCSKGTAIGRLRRVGVGTYRVACPEHEFTSHFGEMPLREMEHPREVDALVAPIPAHLLNEHVGREPMNYVTHDPLTGKREQATEYHGEDEHEGEGE